MNYIYYTILFVMLYSCKSLPSREDEIDKNLSILLPLKVESRNEFIDSIMISYKGVGLKRRINLKDNFSDYYLNGLKIFTVREDCYCIIESLNDSVIIFSKSNYSQNKFISAYHSFLRDEMYFFDSKTNMGGKLELDSPIHIYPVKISSIKTEANDFFIESINFQNKEIVLIDSYNIRKKYNIRPIVIELSCDGNGPD